MEENYLLKISPGWVLYKKQANNKKPVPASQPQSVTQSLRGLTNVKRTLYDPNAPAPKTPPVINIQPITTVRVAQNPTLLQQPQQQPSPSSTNTQQMQEFYQQ